MLKVIIAGGRDFDDADWLDDVVDHITSRRWLDIEIVSGGAKGADALGEEHAKESDYKVIKFPALWKVHGKGAGYIRNVQMAEYANVLIAFWDGSSKGTKHMINTALDYGLEVHVYRYEKGK